MKKSIFTITVLALAIGFSSCEKEVIEIVNPANSELIEMEMKMSPVTDPPKDDVVTDPNEDKDFDADKRNKVKPG